jgi:hypothetical protein
VAKFPGRPFENWEGQGRLVLDALERAEFKTLGDLDHLLNRTSQPRGELEKAVVVGDNFKKYGRVPSNLEAALALAATAENWRKLIPWDKESADAIHRYRSSHPAGDMKRRPG